MNATRADFRRFQKAYNAALSALRTTGFKRAQSELRGYLPCSGPVDLDFALYSSDEILLVPSLLSDGGSSDELFPILDLYAQARAADQSKFRDMIRWCHWELDKALPQVGNADQIKEIAISFSQLPPILKGSAKGKYQPSLAVEEYKNRYEIVLPLQLMANLCRIIAGQGFSPTPYKGLSVNKRQIIDRKGNLIKGLALIWLKGALPNRKLVELLDQCYDNTIRNSLGGHNDYKYHEDAQEYERLSDGVRFSRACVDCMTRRLESVQRMLFVHAGLCYYPLLAEDLGFPSIGSMGNMDIRWVMEGSEVTEMLLLKHWSNFRECDEWPDMIAFYPSPVNQGKKSISVVLGNKSIFPYDLRVFTNDNTLKMLKAIGAAGRVQLKIAAVAPPMRGLVEHEIGHTVIAQRYASVIAQHSLEVQVNKEMVADSISYLESN